MKAYLLILASRMKSGRFFRLAWAWHILRIKKALKIGFRMPAASVRTKIDLVIPTISKDSSLLKEVIAAAQKNLDHEINKIFIVSRKEDFITAFCAENGYVFVDEVSVLGYGKKAISYTAKGIDRSGWMFQQLLKLSGERFVEMENYLVIDSDTILLNPHTFIEGDKYVFVQNEEWNEPYFRSFFKLFGYEAPTSLSYTSHMMIFNTEKLKLMKKEIESKSGMSWDKAYASTASPDETSCISDYETYGNWLLYNFPNQVKDAPFYNRGLSRESFAPLAELTERYGGRYNSISFHSYIS